MPQYAPPVQPVQELASQERLDTDGRLGKNGGDAPSSRLNEYQHQPSYSSANDRDKDNRSHDSQRRPEERRQRDVDNRSLDVPSGTIFSELISFRMSLQHNQHQFLNIQAECSISI